MSFKWWAVIGAIVVVWVTDPRPWCRTISKVQAQYLEVMELALLDMELYELIAQLDDD